MFQIRSFRQLNALRLTRTPVPASSLQRPPIHSDSTVTGAGRSSGFSISLVNYEGHRHLVAPRQAYAYLIRTMPGSHPMTATPRDPTSSMQTSPRFEVADFEQIEAVPCPCGWARRAFADIKDFPGTVHVTEISENARLHYHRRLTETYFVLECEPGAQIQLDSQRLDVHPGFCVIIRPGVRHRAIGKMKVLIFVLPKFDAKDEWFDDDDDDGQATQLP